jgi:hypothetical protein
MRNERIAVAREDGGLDHVLGTHWETERWPEFARDDGDQRALVVHGVKGGDPMPVAEYKPGTWTCVFYLRNIAL